MCEIMRNSRDHVSCAQNLEVTYTFKKLKNLQLLINLNDAYLISMLMFATQVVNKERKRNIFRWRVANSVRISHGSEKPRFLLLSDAYN